MLRLLVVSKYVTTTNRNRNTEYVSGMGNSLPLSGVFENSVSVAVSEIENSRFYLREEKSKRNEQTE